MTTGTGTNLGFDLETDNSTFAQALELFESQNTKSKKIKVGETVTGTLFSITDKNAFIDIANKSSVKIALTTQEKTCLANAEIGSDVSCIITSIVDKQDFEIIGSIYNLKLIEVKEYLDSCYEHRDSLYGVPIEMTHAGYNVSVNIEDELITLFMPHLLTDVNKLPNPESIINTEIEFQLEQIIKDGQKSYSASRTAHLFSLVPKELKKLNIGSEYSGYVTGTTDFAVFVQFNNCLTGMIHKSNLKPEMQERLADIKNGEEITFFVKDIIKNRTFLTQVLTESLWDSVKLNDILEGVVSSVKDFGLMVDLDYETKGLLHKSVLKNDLSTYKKGDKVSVQITNIDKNKRQLTLALR